MIQPKAFLMENVYGLAYANHNRAILERFLGGVRRAGNAHESKVILAADHGVPQLRQRLFVVGLPCRPPRLPVDLWRFEWPDETHDGPHERRIDRDESLVRPSVDGDVLGADR